MDTPETPAGSSGNGLPCENDRSEIEPMGTPAAARSMVAERQRRMRNILAVMRSVFHRTVESAVSLEDVEAHYRGRFDTLARFLSDNDADVEATYDLEELIWDELNRFPTGGQSDIRVTGPAVRLSHSIAHPMALALHELATNAVKFGALMSPGQARIDVAWRRAGGRIIVEWRETGVSIVRTVPLRTGFGREYIEEALPYQIGAETRFELKPGGVAATFILPASLGGE